MEKWMTLVIPVFIGIFLLRTLLLPMKLAAKLALHALCGLVCLWILNAAADITGIFFPLNWVTVLTAGVLGIPGICLMALLELMGH